MTTETSARRLHGLLQSIRENMPGGEQGRETSLQKVLEKAMGVPADLNNSDDGSSNFRLKLVQAEELVDQVLLELSQVPDIEAERDLYIPPVARTRGLFRADASRIPASAVRELMTTTTLLTLKFCDAALKKHINSPVITPEQLQEWRASLEMMVKEILESKELDAGLRVELISALQRAILAIELYHVGGATAVHRAATAAAGILATSKKREQIKTSSVGKKLTKILMVVILGTQAVKEVRELGTTVVNDVKMLPDASVDDEQLKGFIDPIDVEGGYDDQNTGADSGDDMHVDNGANAVHERDDIAPSGESIDGLSGRRHSNRKRK